VESEAKSGRGDLQVRITRRYRGLRLIGDWLPVALWMGVIFVGSSQSVLPGPLGISSVWGEVLRSATHVAEYAILAALSYRAVRNTLRRRTELLDPAIAAPSVCQPQWKAPLLVLAVAVGYAVLDEWHQSFVPNRQFQLLDIALDAAGAAAAVAALRKKN
jgi:VanZ family protein